ncbi:molecular chaperone [Ectopseudomonas mendocina]|uniref:Molecular chaperone n=1 Tax=Ectopseudomonas mendocina TaxID=300 RepID=A0ABZ2RI08_ECTME
MDMQFLGMRTVIFCALLAISFYSQAAVTLGGTRLIFTAPNKEASILARNNSNTDIMIQSWIDADNPSINTNIPFAITPSLSRLGADKQQLLRIFYQGKGADQERESVYWLSVQEIPPKPEKDNVLQIAARHKIKVFYRPTGLTGDPLSAAKELKWTITSKGLEVSNPSKFHVSIANAKLKTAKKDYRVDTDMIRPGETASFAIKGWSGDSGTLSTIDFEVVNDYGGIDRFSTTLN